MAFSSIPAYLDPSNWQQQQNHQIIGSSGSGNPLLAQPPLQQHGGPGVGSIRPGSMAERARIANIPLPETALKCPRCESTNTKFCYFNNYSLTQPRHFCKTCRRYWTRGGALRNVPVGGGCRRNNKRTKQSSSSPTTSNNNNKATTDRAHQPNNNNNNNNNNNKNPSSVDPTTTTGGGTAAAANMLGFPQLRFMSSMSSPLRFSEGFGGGGGEQMGLGGYGGMTAPAEEMGFHGGVEPWRMQQFPFQQEQSTAAGNINYQFSCGGETSIMDGGQMVRPKLTSSMMMSQQIASIKMEERTAALNLSRQLLGNFVPNEQWNNNNNNNDNNSNPNTVNWTDLSNFSSSSTGNHL